MNRPDDYQPACRFYTGVYSTKAFGVIRHAIRAKSPWSTDVIRALDGEVAVCSKYGTIYENGERVTVTPDMLKRVTVNALRCMAKDPLGPDAYAVSLFIEGREQDMPPDVADRFSRLRGKRSDAMSAEIAGCLEEEERKIKDEHGRFAESVSHRNYLSVSQIRGSFGCLPRRVDPLASLAGPVGKIEIDKYLAIDHEVADLNNKLVDILNQYDEKVEEFREIKRALLKCNTASRNERIKTLRSEFREAKRMSKAATV